MKEEEVIAKTPITPKTPCIGTGGSRLIA